ncbi:MAG TPA: hypothetical protein VF857_09390 [Spirochaetota bacterium]
MIESTGGYKEEPLFGTFGSFVPWTRIIDIDDVRERSVSIIVSAIGAIAANKSGIVAAR